jgi:putative phage-type endonuclease
MRKGNVWQLDGLDATPTQNMKEEKWLELRRSGIGGSDIGAIMGLSPWKSAFEVWCDKKGITPAIPTNDDIEFGNRMEPVLRSWAADHLHAMDRYREAQVFASPYLYRNPTSPHHLANVDGVIIVANTAAGAEEGLEIKTASVYQTAKWADGEVPDHYYAQDQWYLHVTGLLTWWMAPLVGKRFSMVEVPRNQQFIDLAVAQADAFWKQVTENTMPAPAGTEGDFDILLSMFPNATEQVLEDDGLEEPLQRYKDLGAEIKEREDEKDEIKARLEQRMGEAKMILAGSLKASWSRFDVDRVDTAKLKADHPEVYEAVKKTMRTGRMTVSENKPKKAVKNVADA